MQMESLVIGYCKCANCNWKDNKFNWHTYFKCERCGSNKYVKEDVWQQLVKDKRKENEQV